MRTRRKFLPLKKKGDFMVFDSARDFIIASTNRFLKPDKSGKGFICPICGSGSGKHGTGITTKDGIHYTC